jgi:Rne/Rng family ribonuclease
MLRRTVPRGGLRKPPGPSISDLLKEGQEIIVQIAKEPLGQKGARITSHIALPGRFLVYMPTVDHMGVSRKIPSDDERARLKRILQNNRTGISGGYIVRTAGEGRSEEELRADMMFLYNLWLDMRQKAERRPAPLLIHHDLNVVERILRDQLTSNFKSIWVDNEEVYESVLRFVERFQPALVNRVKLYTRSARSSTSSASPRRWKRRCGRKCG